jgi:hypothetical protein
MPQCCRKEMSLSRCSCRETLQFAILRSGRARSFAEFTLSAQSEILRFAQNDSEGLRMTVQGAERRVASLNQQSNGSITNR